MKIIMCTVIFCIATICHAQLSTIEQEAQSGDPDAQYQLGLNYFNGIDLLTDKKQAAFWVRNAFENKHAKAKGTWDNLELWKYFDEDSYTHIKIGTVVLASGKSKDWELKANDARMAGDYVKKGNIIKITATGKVVLGSFAGSAGPLGLTNGRYKNYNYVRVANHGALLCKVGEGDVWFEVGKAIEFTVKEDGYLHLLINDRDPSNNSGSFNGTITIFLK